MHSPKQSANPLSFLVSCNFAGVTYLKGSFCFQADWVLYSQQLSSWVVPLHWDSQLGCRYQLGTVSWEVWIFPSHFHLERKIQEEIENSNFKYCTVLWWHHMLYEYNFDLYLIVLEPTWLGSIIQSGIHYFTPEIYWTLQVTRLDRVLEQRRNLVSFYSFKVGTH